MPLIQLRIFILKLRRFLKLINKPKTPQEIEAMRIAGRMLAEVLDKVVKSTKPGITALELAKIAQDEINSLDGSPAFLGVKSAQGLPFPDVICISTNEEVQHGVPSSRVIKEGDIVNFDFGVEYKGMITDAGLTIPVGKISRDSSRLLEATKKALYAGLKQVKAGIKVRKISEAIEAVLEEAKLGIVYSLVGHGVGHNLHEDPEIPNFSSGASDYVLKENQTIAVEPIACLGSGEIYVSDDGWTLLSVDGSPAAHFEHTVRITNTGYEILTPWSDIIKL